MTHLAIQQWGNRNTTPLVLVHGFLCGGRFFRPLVNTLQQDYHIITIDLPGFGDSANIAAADSISNMAKEVQDTLNANGIEQYHLLGHSMGGMVAQQLALSVPAQVVSLIIYASNNSGNLPDRFESFSESKRRLQEDFSASKRRICATWFVNGDANPHFHLLEQCADVVTLATAHRAIDAMRTFDVSNRMAELSMPILIISAEHDRTYTLASQQQLHRQLPQATTALIKNCAHCAHLEDEITFNDTLRAWLPPAAN
ncbi:MAG: alpha/beta hydrolase [Proteobacteria bacterium]|nr:alpha/beta hydrolase [Pseudomonadota bacterium]MCH9758356.1 alpha/beta hydrolase [Pseudomonadota bacterium]